MAIKKLLFVDTNIWLDFYRTRNEAGLSLLKHAENIADKIIVTYQLEGEFKRNRQTVILEAMKELKVPPQIPRLGIFSDAQATKVMAKHLKEVERRVTKLRTQLSRVLDDPAMYDPVYQACQRIFHRDKNSIVLTHDNKLRRSIRRLAFRRFLHGCPPRKRGDTSIGDAFNWEWMIHCAKENIAELVIVSRDSDYGVSYGDKNYINDDLRQEFSDRVSRKRKLLLHQKLSDALKHFARPVTAQEEEAESEIVTAASERHNIPKDQLTALHDILASQIPPVKATSLSGFRSDVFPFKVRRESATEPDNE
jgi:PIN domain